jgi:hypothetical protein
MKEIVSRAREIKELVVSDANHDKFAVMCIGNAETGELITCNVGDASKIFCGLAMSAYSFSGQLGDKSSLEDVLLKVSQMAYEIEKEDNGSGDEDDG